MLWPMISCDTYFNPRAPCGARRTITALLIPGEDISIHAPRAGRDYAIQQFEAHGIISIHAPRAGRDNHY